MLRSVYKLAPKTTLFNTRRCLTTSRPSFLDEKTKGDPFPNLDVRHSEVLDSAYPNLPPIPRPNEDVETRRRRLIYQSRKRGTLENDLLLSTFAKVWLPKFDMQMLTEYDKLLDEPDWDIFYWATNKKKTPEEWQDSKVLAMIKEHAKNEQKVVLRMPDLEEKKQ
jgi:succinate dehydrogenase assembly factor 2